MDLSGQLHRIIEQEKLFEPGDRIVVAVSGGPDSTALLHLLFLLSGRWGWELVAAHANHGFRPEESELEADFVRSQAERLGLPFVYAKLDVPAHLAQFGGNPQDAARQLRYRFLLATAKEQGAVRIALAHHADDQAETVLMRIIRGTGIGGLGGIPSVREEQGVKLVRPLLHFSKDALMGELEEHGLDYCIDSSNTKLKYTRNRLRLETLPHLACYNPSVVESINRLAELASADDDYLEQEAAAAVSRIASVEAGQVRFSRREFAGLHVALQRRFIKLILNYLSLNLEYRDFTAVEQIRTELLEGGRPHVDIAVYGSIRLICEYDSVILGVVPGDGSLKKTDAYAYALEGLDGRIFLPEAGGWLVYQADSAEAASHIAPSSDWACFDAEVLVFPLWVRNRRDGDRMRVDGLNGSKKVKDIFIDDKVPASRRDRMPILTDAEGSLLWIPGIRRSGLARVTEETRQVLSIFFLSHAEM